MYNCSIEELEDLWNSTGIKNNLARDLGQEYYRKMYANMLKQIQGCIADGSIQNDDWAKKIASGFPSHLNVTAMEVYSMYENSPLWMPVEISKHPAKINGRQIEGLCNISPLYCLALMDLIRENDAVCVKASQGGSDREKVEQWKKDKASWVVTCAGDKSADVIFAAARVDESIMNWEVGPECGELYNNFQIARQMYNTVKGAKNGDLDYGQFLAVMENTKPGYYLSALEEVELEACIS